MNQKVRLLDARNTPENIPSLDISLCPLCDGQLRVIEDITDPDLIRKILDHVNSQAPSRLSPRRANSYQTPPDLFADR